MSELRQLGFAFVVLSSLAVAPAALAQALLEGPLFTSPEQREYLDYLREDFLAKNQKAGFDITESEIPEIPVDGPAGPIGPAEYTLGGIMKRADGRMTIWLNNQSLTEDQLPPAARLVRMGNTLALQFSTAAGTQVLRPGQTIEVTTGVVQERYQRPPEPVVEEAAADNVSDEDAASADTAEAAATDSEDSGPAAAETADPTSIAESLSADILDDPSALEAVIETLQSLRDDLDVDEDE